MTRFPELNQLLTAYFNQDWDYDYENPDAVVADFLVRASTSNLTLFVAEVADLLTLSDEHVDKVISSWHSSVDTEGRSYRQWLADVREAARRTLHERGWRPTS